MLEDKHAHNGTCPQTVLHEQVLARHSTENICTLKKPANNLSHWSEVPQNIYYQNLSEELVFIVSYKLGKTSLESRDKLLLLIHRGKMLHIPEFISTNVKQPILKLDIYIKIVRHKDKYMCFIT